MATRLTANTVAHPNMFASTDVAALSHKGRGHNNVGHPFPNRTNFVIARVCAFARSSQAFGGAHDENASKHDDYHIN